MQGQEEFGIAVFLAKPSGIAGSLSVRVYCNDHLCRMTMVVGFS